MYIKLFNNLAFINNNNFKITKTTNQPMGNCIDKDTEEFISEYERKARK